VSEGVVPLAGIRRATAPYHRLEVAVEDGYQLGYNEQFPFNTCITHPTAGAMGYHCSNLDLIHHLGADPLRPEGLVYEPGPHGKLSLVAVEWVVPSAAWHADGISNHPRCSVWTCTSSIPPWGWYIHHPWVEAQPGGDVRGPEPSVDCP
jgi:hypothetical protein